MSLPVMNTSDRSSGTVVLGELPFRWAMHIAKLQEANVKHVVIFNTPDYYKGTNKQEIAKAYEEAGIKVISLPIQNINKKNADQFLEKVFYSIKSRLDAKENVLLDFSRGISDFEKDIVCSLADNVLGMNNIGFQGYTVINPKYLDTVALEELASIRSCLKAVQTHAEIDPSRPLTVSFYFDPVNGSISMDSKHKDGWQLISMKIDEAGPSIALNAPAGLINAKNSCAVDLFTVALEKFLKAKKTIYVACQESIRYLRRQEFTLVVNRAMPDFDGKVRVHVTMDGETKPINANPILLNGKSYMASAEPTISKQIPKAHAAFWNAMMAQNSSIIVKLSETKEIPEAESETPEQTKKRLEAKDRIYWPSLGKATIYKDILVSNIQEDQLEPNLVRRTFLARRGLEERVILHFDYTGWPDGHTPMLSDVMKISKKIQEQLLDKLAPETEIKDRITVHCKGGIGRTGTFIAIHSLLGKDEPNVADTVMSLRMQRPGANMVETSMQYDFIYNALEQQKA